MAYDITRHKMFIYLVSCIILGIYALCLAYSLCVLVDVVLLFIKNYNYMNEDQGNMLLTLTQEKYVVTISASLLLMYLCLFIKMRQFIIISII